MEKHAHRSTNQDHYLVYLAYDNARKAGGASASSNAGCLPRLSLTCYSQGRYKENRKN